MIVIYFKLRVENQIEKRELLASEGFYIFFYWPTILKLDHSSMY